MPELPEVESVRVALAGGLAGRRVEDVRLNAARRGPRRRRFATVCGGGRLPNLGGGESFCLRRWTTAEGWPSICA